MERPGQPGIGKAVEDGDGRPVTPGPAALLSQAKLDTVDLCMEVFTDFLDRDTSRIHWRTRHIARSRMVDILSALREDIMKRLHD